MAENTQTTTGGIGLGGLLGVVFIALKLTHYIDWPWVWVLSPFWIPFVLVIAILLIFVIGFVLFSMFTAAFSKKKIRSSMARSRRAFP